MEIYKQLRSFVFRHIREWYSNRISLPYGINAFLGNVAFIQLEHNEHLFLNPCSAYVGTIHVTTVGMRPLLTYSLWVEGEEWKPEMPKVQVIVEARGFQVKAQGAPETNWEVVSIDDKRVAPLKDLFLAFAFYAPLRAEWKRPNTEIVQ